MGECRMTQWCTIFKNGCTGIDGENRTPGRPILVTGSESPSLEKSLFQNYLSIISTIVSFLTTNVRLVTECLDNGAELEADVNDRLNGHATEFYTDGNDRLVHRCDKCLNLNDDYIENVFKSAPFNFM